MQKLITAFFLSLMMLSACTTTKLNYLIDPEITDIQQLGQHAKLIAVSVVDARSASSTTANERVIIATGPQDEASVLKTKLIERLKQNNLKIISNPLLADISIEITIEQLQATIESKTFKSEISVTSDLRMLAKRKGKPLEKLYKMRRAQTVANPANQADVTGVVNQLLSEQLSQMLADPALVELAKSKISNF